MDTFPTSIRAEAVMPIEFQILRVRVQDREHLGKTESKHRRLEQLLELEKGCMQSMWFMEEEQCRRCRAFRLRIVCVSRVGTAGVLD